MRYYAGGANRRRNATRDWVCNGGRAGKSWTRLDAKIHPRRKPRMQSSQPAGDSSTTQPSPPERGNSQRQRRQAKGQAVRGNLETRLRGKRRKLQIQGNLGLGRRRRQRIGRGGATRKFHRRRDQRKAIRGDPVIEPLAKPEGALRGDSEDAPAGAGRSETRGNLAADHRRYRRAETGETRRSVNRHRRMDVNYWETDSSIAGKAGPMWQAGQPARLQRRREAAGRWRGNSLLAGSLQRRGPERVGATQRAVHRYSQMDWRRGAIRGAVAGVAMHASPGQPGAAKQAEPEDEVRRGNPEGVIAKAERDDA